MDYIPIDDAVAADGSEIQFQSKTPKFTGASGLTRTGSVGCRTSSKSEGLPWERDGSGHEWDDCIGFTVECPVGRIMERHCRLDGTSESLCESLRLRSPCVEKWVWGKLMAASRVSWLSSAFPIL